MTGGYYARGPVQPKGGRNGLATASLVLGILWGFGMLSLLAFVLGLVALSQIKRHRQTGRGLAIAGVVLGALGFVGTAIPVAVIIVDAGLDLGKNVATCTKDTRTLRTAEEAAYAQTGEYVNELDLLSGGYLSEPSSLHNITITRDGRYVVTITDDRCGTIGHPVEQEPFDY